MNNKLSELSKHEWLIMKICWDGKATARQIHEKALRKKDWEYQTVKTMLDRLVKKGYLQREKFGPVYIYETSVPQTTVVYNAVENFVNTALDNTIMPLFTHFVKEKKLSDQDIASMKKIISEYEESQGGDRK